MTILVFGKTGQIASALSNHPKVVCLDRRDAELTKPSICSEAIYYHQPSAVINAAAYTAVDRAEDEEGLATLINGTAPSAMAQSCKQLDIPFVHISTDYVFDGSGDKAWKPNDERAPLNAYGRSKLAGEQAIQSVGGRYAILRTSWVFSSQGANFVKTMLHASKTCDRLNVVSDQVGGPTPASAIAEACVSIALQLSTEDRKSGVYHFCGSPVVSWHGFAETIFKRAQRAVSVTPISTRNYPTPAPRPLNSRLNCNLTKEFFDIDCPDWRDALNVVLEEIECGND